MSDENNGINEAFPSDTNGSFGNDYDDGAAVEQGNTPEDSGDSGSR